jgi:hypothetical protein
MRSRYETSQQLIRPIEHIGLGPGHSTCSAADCLLEGQVVIVRHLTIDTLGVTRSGTSRYPHHIEYQHQGEDHTR